MFVGYSEIAPQKYLDSLLLLGYSNYRGGMAHVLQVDKKIAVIGVLAEGNSIRFRSSAMSSQSRPKPVGRPKLAKGDAKAEMLRVRATPDERKRVEKTAKETNRSVSDLARVLMAPSISIGDTVSVEGKDGLYVVIAGWPGKPRYFIAPEGEYSGKISWRDWVDPTALTLVKKNESNANFQQFWPRF